VAGDIDENALASAGFDIVHAFDATAAARESGLEVLDGDQRRGLLIGNTRLLWPPFVAAMREPALAAERDPLERYVERAVGGACSGRIYYSHRRYDGSFLPFQRLAVATGLGALSDGGLVVHPVYGPWFALRAIAVVDGEPVARRPIAKPCACRARCSDALRIAHASGSWRAWLGVREACTLDEWRYSDDQIRYHYTKVWDSAWSDAAPIAGTDRTGSE